MSLSLEQFPITWNHVIEKESLNFKELEHVLIEKVEQLFRDMHYWIFALFDIGHLEKYSLEAG